MANLDKRTALLIIDFQKGFDDPRWGKRNNPHAEERAAQLLEYFRTKSLPIYHVQHLSRNHTSPLRPGQIGVDFKNEAKPVLGERIFQKHVNSAFIGTNLEETLRKAEVGTLVIFGIAVDHCVSTTTRMAANLGFEVFLAADATIAHARKGVDGGTLDAEVIHEVSLASLQGEFATVDSTEGIIRRLESTALQRN